MNDDERAIAREWLKKNRGDMTQEDLAPAIVAATGWKIERSRYSKYESGATPFGKVVLNHFIDYWKTRGVAGPDLSPAPPVAPGTTEPTDLAAAVLALTDELAAMRLEREAWTRGVAAVLRSYEDGRVPTDLLDALVPPPRVDAQP